MPLLATGARQLATVAYCGSPFLLQRRVEAFSQLAERTRRLAQVLIFLL